MAAIGTLKHFLVEEFADVKIQCELDQSILGRKETQDKL